MQSGLLSLGLGNWSKVYESLILYFWLVTVGKTVHYVSCSTLDRGNVDYTVILHSHSRRKKKVLIAYGWCTCYAAVNEIAGRSPIEVIRRR